MIRQILGGGLFVKTNDVWYVRGIFSAFAIDDDGSCDWSNYGIFTKVDAFNEWIEEVMRQYSQSKMIQYNPTASRVTSTKPTVSELSFVPSISTPQPFRNHRTSLQCNYQPMKVVHRPEVGNV